MTCNWPVGGKLWKVKSVRCRRSKMFTLTHHNYPWLQLAKENKYVYTVHFFLWGVGCNRNVSQVIPPLHLFSVPTLVIILEKNLLIFFHCRFWGFTGLMLMKIISSSLELSFYLGKFGLKEPDLMLAAVLPWKTLNGEYLYCHVRR